MKKQYVFKYTKDTKLLNFRVDGELREAIDEWSARHPKLSVSELVRIAVRTYLSKDDSEAQLNMMKENLGIVVQKTLERLICKFMEEGFVESEDVLSLLELNNRSIKDHTAHEGFQAKAVGNDQDKNKQISFRPQHARFEKALNHEYPRMVFRMLP